MAEQKTPLELFDSCDKHFESLNRIQLFRREGKKRIPTKVVYRVSSASIKALDHFNRDEKGNKLGHKFEGPTALKAMELFFNYLKEVELI